MPEHRPKFVVRETDDGHVIDAVWPDGRVEQLLGVYVLKGDAERWIRERSADWVPQTRITGLN